MEKKVIHGLYTKDRSTGLRISYCGYKPKPYSEGHYRVPNKRDITCKNCKRTYSYFCDWIYPN